MKLINLWKLAVLPFYPFMVVGFLVGMICISAYMGWLWADKFLTWVAIPSNSDTPETTSDSGANSEQPQSPSNKA